ncbi:hypothetical protein IDH44_03470 [Paenibacillus sp. IB182496]|uniref:Uncharacterized protein n=1 Tax=Paenibacillus sabuli TaxID=2772509 RepID=A0A927BQ67_9BACL|nr:hypothetical protein [Paenibacillus sabuli]MBD2844237.1 hypothetical protein [Paenibacillus sabuli]
MNTTVKIPQGDSTVTVELTVKEVMALAGIKFYNNHRVEVDARRKLNEALSVNYGIEQTRKQDPIPYQMLN